MRIPSGVADQYVYFVAVDSTDLTTRETGLSSFTVYRSRDGAAAAAMTTPTINETDATNMPGVYELLCDEDTTIGAGNDSEEMAFHITHAGMAPVTRVVEIYRPKITAGYTLGVESDGDLSVVNDVTNQLSVDVVAISGDTTSADNLELQYDGTGLTGDTYPSTQAQVGNIASGTAATNTVASNFVPATGDAPVETLTYESTQQLNDVSHDLAPNGVSGNTDGYYVFNVGGNGVPVSIQWQGYANSNGDDYTFEAYNWVGTSWDQVGSKAGLNGTTIVTEQLDLTNSHVGTGANLGLVHLRIYSTDGTNFSTDRILCSYATVNQSVGYANGAIWVDTLTGTAGTVSYVNGTADNPVLTWADALTLSSNLGLDVFEIDNGSTITLSANSDGYSLIGNQWVLALGGQSIEGAYFEGASVSGVGTATVTPPKFKESRFGTVTLPPCGCQTCGFGMASGEMTAGSAGQFIMVDCFSLVPGSGSPTFNYDGLGATAGINTRRWAGGSIYILDSNCTLSHEVLAGGGTSVTVGGANVEIRGICRSVTLTTVTSASTVQIVGVVGPITIGGADGIVNVYGVSSTITDNRTGSPTLGNTATVKSDTAAIISSITGIEGATFDTSTDSLEAIRNRGDAAWTTGAGGSSPTVEEIRTEMDDNSTQLIAIVADTNELQTDDIPGKIAALDTVVDGIETKVDIMQGNVTDILADTDTTIPAQLDSMAGAGFVTGTDSLEAIRNQGDSAWTTGAGGTAPTVGEIRTELEGAGTHLTLIKASTDNLPSDPADQSLIIAATDAIKAETALIVADTNELQTDDIPGKLVALDAVVDTVKADTTSILVDTNELQLAQGDWLTATGFSTASALSTHDGKLDTAQADLDILTGSDGATLATSQGNYAPAKVSDLGVVQTDDHTAEIAKIPKSDGTASWNATALAALADSVLDEVMTDLVDNDLNIGESITLRKAARGLFNRFFREVTQTASAQIVKNDSAAQIATMAVSDDATTQTKGTAT